MPSDLPTVGSLDELAALVGDRRDLYLRWSAGPEKDRRGYSRDELTGVDLPGLSVNALAVEPWWEGRPLRLWAARRLYDYHHLPHRRGPDVRPWVLAGRECGRGPDNEPLVTDIEPVAWVDPAVADEATRTIEGIKEDWGPIHRADSR